MAKTIGNVVILNVAILKLFAIFSISFLKRECQILWEIVEIRALRAQIFESLIVN